MKVNLNNTLSLTYRNKHSKSISMKAKLPVSVEKNVAGYNFGNETEFCIDNLSRVLSIFKNKDLASILSKIIKSGKAVISQSIVNFFIMFDDCLENVNHEKIKIYITEELKKIADLDFKNITANNETDVCDKLSNLSNITDACNTLDGLYSCIFVPEMKSFSRIELKPTLSKSYLNFIKEEPKIYNEFNSELESCYTSSKKRWYRHSANEFINMQHFEPIVNFSNLKDNEIENFIFSKFYLKSKLLLSPFRKMLSDIYKSYGVKVLITDCNKDSFNVLKIIKEELKMWQTYSNGKAKFPPSLIFTPIDENFVNRATPAYFDSKRNLYIDSGFNLCKVSSCLRSEITRLNEQKPTFINKFMSHKTFSEKLKNIYKRKEIQEESKKTGFDFEKCKYREEFLKAGIPQHLIRYAYFVNGEFLPVIALGDISRCSEEFKKYLVERGLPEFVLNMPCYQNPIFKNNVEKVQKIMEQHPEATTYDSLMKYFQ